MGGAEGEVEGRERQVPEQKEEAKVREPCPHSMRPPGETQNQLEVGPREHVKGKEFSVMAMNA